MTKPITIATWNVNSIRARREHFLAWLDRSGPDVVCLQELKTEDDGFPFMELDAVGYSAVTCPQKTYNGVAIVSKLPIREAVRGMGDADPQARIVSAEIEGIRVICAYVPNGSEVGTDKYEYKKEWLERFTSFLTAERTRGLPMVVCGDFNIAPTALDVSSESEWGGTVIYNDDMSRAFDRIARTGLVDVFRMLNPEKREFSWWDYRMAGFRRNAGLRLDFVMATPELAGTAKSAVIDRAERAREKPSDHAPVLVSFG